MKTENKTSSRKFLGIREKITGKLEHWQMIAAFLIIYDLIVVCGSYFAALWIRFDCNYTQIPANYLDAWLRFAPIYALVSIFVFWKLRLYQSIWRFASFVELERICFSSVILGVAHTVLITVLFDRMPITYYVLGIVVQSALLIMARFAYRFVLLERSKREAALQNAKAIRVMLIGAGTAGQLLLRDLNGKIGGSERVCCIIDDNKNKWGRFIDGVPIVGGRDDILLNAEKFQVDSIYVAIPSATAEQRRDILDICKETGCKLKNLPSIYSRGEGDVTAKSVVDVDVEDLLGRAPVKVNMDEIGSFLGGKVVLVTGGGGSIGSELCRQIARHQPRQLIVFDVYENNAHAIGLELKDNYPDLDLVVLIGSVRDSRRIYLTAQRSPLTAKK